MTLSRLPTRAAEALRAEGRLRHDHAVGLLASRFNLRPAAPGAAGHDATDALGRTYRVKTRVVADLGASTSFDFRPRDAPLEFDDLLGVFYSPDFAILGVIRVPREVVRELGRVNRDSLRLRWTRRTAADLRIAKVIWPSP